MEIMSSSEYRLVFVVYAFLCKEMNLEKGGDIFAIHWIENTYRLYYNGDVDPTEFSRWIAYQLGERINVPLHVE